ncbi:MAG: hypothetical protein NXI22_23895 [bacterium]|nr:hypothetical protein [bacterium]
MRTIVLGLVVGLFLAAPLAGLLAVIPVADAQIPGVNRPYQASANTQAVPAQAAAPASTPTQVTAGSGLIVTSTVIEGKQQLTLIDPVTRAISVYHIASDGRLTLKSVRDAQWDMQIDDYNGATPSPREIRALLHP